MVIRQGELAATLVELADTLVSDYDLSGFLDLLVERSVSVVGAGAGGVLLGEGPDSLRPVAASNEKARLLELFELQSFEGPCIDSYRLNQQVVEDDLLRTSRWPSFTPLALAGGYQSALAIPMRLRGEVIGALNLFRVQPGPVERAGLDAAQAFADMATIGILQQRAASDARQLAAQLQGALTSRIVLEQAKGILAERAQLDVDGAYEVLRWYARNHNLRLGDVAAGVVSGGVDSGDVARTPRPAPPPGAAQ